MKPVPAEPIVEAKPAPAVVQAVPQAIIQESPEKPAQPTSGPVTSTSSGSLFGNSKIPTGSLFGNVSTGGFFGNSSQTPATQISFAGLTEGAKKEAEAPAAVQSSKPPSLFANVTSHGPPTFIPTKSGLFDGLLNSNVSNGTGCGTNLFGGNPTPLSNMFARPSGDAQAGGDDDEEANVDPDEEVVPGQEDKADPSKATGDYKYESKTSVLITVNTSPDSEICEQLQEGFFAGVRCRICKSGEVRERHSVLDLQKRSQSYLAQHNGRQKTFKEWDDEEQERLCVGGYIRSRGGETNTHHLQDTVQR